MNIRKYICEFIGTAVLVLFGCGTAVISGGDLVATAVAFGLSIIAMAYVIGNISGCHVNPAVSLAVLINGKMNLKDFFCYVIAQIAGAFAGAGILYFILYSSKGGVTALGTNGFESASAVGISMAGAFVVELVLTFVFIYTILGVTSDEKKGAVAGIVIGCTLTFVHLIGINLTGTSVNPARSLAPAVIMGGKALQQLWLFVLVPLLGSVIAAVTYRFLNKETK